LFVRVLLIEDDKRLSTLIVKTLSAEGFRVDVANNGDDGVEIALNGAHDLAIVDWMLPGRDGPAVCQAVRAARLPIGILMLTARSQIEDRVSGLYSGADDYLTKPFAFDELIARLYALNRRLNGNVVDSFELRVGNLVIDTHTHTARRAESSLNLTKTEWTMLECFMRHPGQTLSRQFLLNYVWSYTTGVQPSLVDVYVSYLRKRLKIAERKDPIHTQRGFGYFLDPADA
jgi:two-component system OmpR family response regulator